jgi:hypothetical protein
MKRALAWTLLGAGALLAGAPALAQLPIQMDVSSTFNADVVDNGAAVAADTVQAAAGDPSSPATNYAFVTQSSAVSLGGAASEGLPDTGHFADSELHPSVQLAYRDSDNGKNVHRSPGPESFSFGTPRFRYSAVHLFAASVGGPSTLSVTFTYRDGVTVVTSATIPDWTSTPAPTADLYSLASRLLAARPSAPFQLAPSPAYSLFGVRVPAAHSRILVSITIARAPGAGVLDFFGATGVTEVDAGCPVPGAPSFPITTDTITSGDTYFASWSASPGLQAGGTYALAGLGSPSGPLIVGVMATDTSVSFATKAAAQDSVVILYVSAVQPCGAASAPSAPLTVTVKAAPPHLVFTSSGPTWVVAPGTAPPSTTVKLKNVGGTPANVTLSTRDGFFSVQPSTVTIAAGLTETISLTPLASALSAPGFHQGRLAAAAAGQSVSTPVTLAVSSASPATLASTKLKSSSSRVFFLAPEGQTPAVQKIDVTLSQAVAGALVAAKIGPGGTWLQLSSDELSSPVGASGTKTLTLTVDRTRRAPEDGPPPLRTLLRLHAAGAPDDLAHSAVVEVVDGDAPPVTDNAAASRPLHDRSFLIPVAVKSSGLQGSSFYSDGWLRNISQVSQDVTLFYTPDGRDGTSDPGVLKAVLTLPPGNVLRTSDLLGSVFATTGSGTVDVHAQRPGALTVRSTVEAVTGGDAATRYGTEIPVVARGSGAAVTDPELVIPGVSDDAVRRANLIVAETSGAPATATATLYGPLGDVLGSLTLPVAPFSKTQVNRIGATIAPGRQISGGSLAIKVVAGGGTVFPLVTVLDNRSNSFSVLRGGVAFTSAPTSSIRRALDATTASSAPALIVPSAVRLTGALNTHYTTGMSIVNGTAQPADLALTYSYVDVNAGNASKTTNVTQTIAPRGSLAEPIADDVLANLFLVTDPSYGWMRIDGDTPKVLAVAGISTAVDPSDPSKGLKTAQVNAVLEDSDAVMVNGAEDNRFSGAEKSDERRTNVVLVETGGDSAEVTISLATPTGESMGERTYPVAPGQYLQINDVFGDVGVGDGPFQNAEVLARVSSGLGRVIALVTMVDNVSASPEIFVVQPGGVPPPTIGF